MGFGESWGCAPRSWVSKKCVRRCNFYSLDGIQSKVAQRGLEFVAGAVLWSVVVGYQDAEGGRPVVTMKRYCTDCSRIMKEI